MYEDEPHATYVKFGKLASQELRLDVTETLLDLFHSDRPELFGWYLARAMTGTAPRTARGRK